MTTNISVNNSLSYTDKAWCLGAKYLLIYAMGCPYCIITAPIPLPLAFIFTMKGKENSGIERTGEEIKACLSVSKAIVASFVHSNPFFISKSYSGQCMLPNPWMNLL